MARVRVGRYFIPTNWQTIRTVSSSLEVDFLEFVFCNTHATADAEVEVRFVPAGATAGSQHLAIDLSSGNAMIAGETRTYQFIPHLKAGDRIQWKASAANAVSGSAAINEAVALTGGAARVRHNRQFLPSAAANLSPAVTSAKQVTHLEFAFCNTSNAAKTVQVWIVSSGAGTLDDRYKLVDLRGTNAIGPGETLVYSFAPFLQSNDYIRWVCDTANAVTGDVSMIEE